MWFIYLVIVVVGLIVLDRWIRNDEGCKIHGPKGIFILANTLDFLMDSVKTFYYFAHLTSTYKKKLKLQLGPKKFILIYNPEDIEVLISGTKHNRKGFIYSFIKPWLKTGLLLSDGVKWQQRRKILTYAFHFKILRHFNSILDENTEQLVNQLQDEVNNPQTDVLSYINEFALNSIVETAMGIKLDSESANFGKRYKKGICDLGQLLVYRCQRVWMYPQFTFAFSEAGRNQKEILDLLTSFRDRVVNKRRETNKSQNIILDDVNENDEDDFDYNKKRLAMLDLLLQAEKEGAIDAEGIGEEVDTFMFEGHDTTARALQFAFMLLANNPDVQDKIVAECEQIFGSSDKPATINELGQMKYLECCIKESLRLYPPVMFISRKIDEEVQLQDVTLPPGSDCTILISVLHRLQDQFVEPLEFRPERFMVEPTWHPYAYIPFSAGPRNCIGQKFAMMEMKLVLSAVLRHYRLLPISTPRDLIMSIDFLLRARDPVYVKFEKRV